jgi:hypothetical protein
MPGFPNVSQSGGIAWRNGKRAVEFISEGRIERLAIRDGLSHPRFMEWNPINHEVILKREGLWSHPLYYRVGEKEVLIADSLRGLLSELPDRPALDFQALDAYLALEFFPAPLTPFSEIRKVGVEEVCRIDLKTGASCTTALPLPERVAEEDFESSAEAVWRGFQEAMDECIALCPSEVVLMCSGGLDSTLLAHLMRGRGRALVLSYANSWKDEVERARKTALNSRLPLEEVRLGNFGIDHMERYVRLMDEPLGGTGNFAWTQLCTRVPRGSWIVGGNGSGVLSLMNVNHKHLRSALEAGPITGAVDRFSKLVTYLDQDGRQKLLGYDNRTFPDPVHEMWRRERGSLSNPVPGLFAVVRRQLCVEEEMSQIWPIHDALDQTPVMPFFDTRVHRLFDRLPETNLRDDAYKRRLLRQVVHWYCPGYEEPTRQLGYGLPLGVPGYPDVNHLNEMMDACSRRLISRECFDQMAAACDMAQGAKRFSFLRRLWTALVLEMWLEQRGCL